MTLQRPICVVMAVYRPDLDFLKLQMQSIVDQSVAATWLVAVCADGVSEDDVAACAKEIGLQAGVLQLVTSDQELDSVRAFEKGLEQALSLTEATPDALIALSDQDDVWHRDRLERGVDVLSNSPDTMLVHSDARIVDGQGAELHRSMFELEKRHRSPGLRGLLYRNNVTGMTALMRREIVELALPFPDQSGVHYYHDLWLALIASAMGRVQLIDAPLVDYRQHGGNAIGAVDRQSKGRGIRRIVGELRADRVKPTGWFRREAAGYGLARYLGRSVQARVSLASAQGYIFHDRADTSPLRPYLRFRFTGLTHFWDALKYAITGHFRLGRIAAGQGVVCTGRLIWALRRALGQSFAESVTAFDERIFSMSPGMPPPHLGRDGAVPLDGRKFVAPTPVKAMIDLRKRAGWTPQFTAKEPCLTLLIPSLNPTEAFAGIATAIDIGIGLAARGHRVRMIATDLPISSPDTTRRFVLGRMSFDAKEAGAAERISVECGVMGDGIGNGVTLPAHKDDVFFATAWWSAHAASAMISEYGFTQSQIIYLIQDFEPNFYPWGPEFADAMASYHLNFFPVFNTTLLRDHFIAEGFDFAAEADVLSFRPSIDLRTYAGARPASNDGPRKLAVYGRPEVARNMFSTTLEGLMLFLRAENLRPTEIELVSVGMSHGPISFDDGHVLTSLGKLPFERYPGFLLGVDLGLSLMYSPHPSHPPIEMAASGVRVVTNAFGPKDLSQLSGAIASVPATPEAVALALSKQWHAGPATEKDRKINLALLGDPIEDMLAKLSHKVAALGISTEDET